MAKLITIIKDLLARGFWGTIEVKVEDGKVMFIQITEKIKP
ncbi:DUF2292 domain-containing protein [Candidatus Pacearchaeota archaeon]|jgi:hypothetical protein|nr:DUF2292 domain-containing protein [Candidatus Pacearchaeota archaeon]